MVNLISLSLSLLIFQNFSFVVIGDRTAGAKNEIFERVIEETKILAPDFIVNVGDLIEGYTKDLKTVQSEWNYILGQLKSTDVQYYLTPGNHDIWDVKSASIYVQRFGKTYYSFDYEKSHFIIIDNSRYNSVSEMPQEQLIWLEQDLTKHKKAHFTFCFMHKPFWKDVVQADVLHRIFRQGGVDYVFSGHDHHYLNMVRDSIVYIQVGPSGSRFKVYSTEEQGAFQNYLMVKVKNDKVKITVIKPGSMLPYDVVTADDVVTIDRIEAEAINISKVIIPEIQPLKDTIALQIANITNKSFNMTLKWNYRPTYWQIFPESVSCSLPVNSNGYYRFNCTLKKPDSIYPLPELTFSYPYDINKAHKVKKFLPIQRIATCRKVKRPPVIDGSLDDECWGKTESISTFGSAEGNLSELEKTIIFFGFDDKALYVAAKCFESKMNKLKMNIKGRDEAVYKDDHLNMILQPEPNSNIYYQIFINPIGTIWDRHCSLQPGLGRGVKDASWNSKLTLKTNREKDGWTLELSIPFSQFPNLLTEEWGFNILRYQSGLDKVGIYQVPFIHDPKTFALLKFVN
ncbi:MAG: metallophosphoesterase [candidate division WOR-3 bacterium]|nr:metallophosphoesterase [candidate division WOR-3 bacterium]